MNKRKLRISTKKGDREMIIKPHQSIRGMRVHTIIIDCYQEFDKEKLEEHVYHLCRILHCMTEKEKTFNTYKTI